MSTKLEEEGDVKGDGGVATLAAEVVEEVPKPNTQLKRVLSPAQVALMALASTVGTGYFVNMGKALVAAGPLPLFLTYCFWCLIAWCINECAAEMVTRTPIASSFSRFNGRWIDEAYGVAISWNVWLGVCSFFAYELTAFCAVVNYWKELNPAILITVLLVAYSFIQLWDTRYFGRIEFVAVCVKLLIAFGLILFVLVTMCGGNPQHDAYGFRYWRDPGPIAQKGASNQVQAFMTCLLNASFAVAGPDAIANVAGDVVRPRKSLPLAFRSVLFRLITFFVIGTLALGCLTPYNDENLIEAYATGAAGAAKSPWVAGIKRLDIPALPSIVNAGLLFTIFSTGNFLLFAASRVLYGIAEEGHTFSVLKRTNRNGVPYVCVLCNLAIGCLAYLQCGSGTSVVLDWFTSLANSGQIIICAYLAFYRACKAQGVDRNTFVYKGRFQPYTAWFALIVNVILLFLNGYSVFLKDSWSTPDFIYDYFAVFWGIAWWVGWKVYKRTSFIKPSEADLWRDIAEIDAEEAEDDEAALPATRKEKIMSFIF